ncbi:MAG: PHB depolymerase family esterase [Pseudomonadota bacterium]
MLYALALIAALIVAPTAARACVEQTPCFLGDRSYHVKLPDTWDGVSPMPVMLHFHGWQRQGTLIVKHGRISGATRRVGVLLLAPNGRRKSWNFWSDQSEDIAFARRVLEDAARTYPIDRSRIYISGYSYGAAMAWRFVCADGAGVAALLAVSGTLDQDEDCAGAVPVRHVHGLRDTVMDFPMGPGGDTTHPVALWRRQNGCAGPPQEVRDWSVTKHDTFTRHVWRDCTSDKPVTLDLHARGHFIPRGWFRQQLDELLAEPTH